MKHNKIKVLALIAIISSVALVSFAYLTSPTETLVNMFTVGRITEPTIEEPNFPEDPELTPGTVIGKDPTITINENTIESYVYMAVKSRLVYLNDEDVLVDVATYYHGSTFAVPAPGEVLDPGTLGFSTAWELVGNFESTEVDNRYMTAVYRFNTTVQTGDTKLVVDPTLFTAVGFDATVTEEILDEIDMVDGQQSIDVKAFVHQKVDGMPVADIDTTVFNFFKDDANWR